MDELDILVAEWTKHFNRYRNPMNKPDGVNLIGVELAAHAIAVAGADLYVQTSVGEVLFQTPYEKPHNG